jgi:hypothetical protein
MKKVLATIFLLLITFLGGCTMDYGTSPKTSTNATSSQTTQSKSFTISVANPVTVGERAEIIIHKSYDFSMLHKDYTFSIVGDNSVGGTFEFQSVGDYTHKYFKATKAGTVQIQAKNTTSGTLFSNILTITVNDISSNLILSVPQMQPSTKTISQASNLVKQSWSYTLTNENESKTFSFTAQTANNVYLTSGRFYFTSTYNVNWLFKDASNNTIASERYGSNAMTVVLTIGHTYSITITEYSTKGNVTINAYAPNGVSVVTGFSTVNDRLWWKGQQAVYTYTPQQAGRYRLSTPFSVNWQIKDSFNNIIKVENYGTKDFEVNLNANETYTFTMTQYSNTGNVELFIHAPNPQVVVTGKQKIIDVMRYTNQQNAYVFTPSITAKYDLTTTYNVNWLIKDSFNNTVMVENYGSKSKSITLNAGEQYTIYLTQYGSTKGEYTLEIKK